MGNSKIPYQVEECSFEAGNLTCPQSSEVEDNYELEEGEGGLKKIPGWPIIVRKVWQYRLWSFQGRNTKLERFLTKNQHT